jgi:hypothetical protein
MSEELSKAPEELEPEAKRPGSAPAKKPLAEFLADFEARLRDHPDEPATGAVQVVEDRAAGLRRSPAPAAPAPPDLNPAAGALDVAPPPAADAIADVAVEDVEAVEIANPEAAADPPAADGGSADASGESRRLRGRRRRKHRHRAH